MGRLKINDPLDTRMAKALSHPVRVRAMAILEEREASPSEIARELVLPVVNVSHHIKVLRDLGCIEQVAVRHVRGAIEHRYRLIRQTTVMPEDLELMPEDGYRWYATHIVARAIDQVRDAVNGDAFYRRTDNHFTWTPLELDEQGWKHVYDLLLETLERALAEEEASKARLAAGESKGPLIRSRLTIFHHEAGDPAPDADADADAKA